MSLAVVRVSRSFTRAENELSRIIDLESAFGAVVARGLSKKSLARRKMEMNDRIDRQPVVIALVMSLCGFIAVIAFTAGLLTQRNLLDEEPDTALQEISSLSADSAPGLEESVFPRVDQVEQLIADEYYNRPADDEKSDEFWSNLEGHALQGLSQGLDGYSAYLPPVKQQEVANQLEGTVEGIGVWVAVKGGNLTIVAPIPGSPAEEAGIRAGDNITEIDSQTVEGLTDADALELLRGPSGKKVHLVITRSGADSPLVFDVERKKMPVPVVNYDYLEDDDISVIEITVFGDKTESELDAALALAKSDGAAGIVVDLRNNGGGWVQSAQETIGRFISEEDGPALYEDFDPSKDGDEQPQPILSDGEKAFDIPVAVLVNGGTASAAEIVAGAFSDYHRGVLVGERTFGKGSVQRVHEFEDGSSFRLTFAHWLTPQKHVIDGLGIEPDVHVEQGDRGDEQLDAAINLLRGKADA
jgi:carboxyl-terminal processing protease